MAETRRSTSVNQILVQLFGNKFIYMWQLHGSYTILVFKIENVHLHSLICSFVRSYFHSSSSGGHKESHLKKWAYAGPHDSYKTFRTCSTCTVRVKFILIHLPMHLEPPRSVTSNGRLLCKQCGRCMVEVKVLDGWVYSSFGIPSFLPLSTMHT